MREFYSTAVFLVSVLAQKQKINALQNDYVTGSVRH